MDVAWVEPHHQNWHHDKKNPEFLKVASNHGTCPILGLNQGSLSPHFNISWVEYGHSIGLTQEGESTGVSE